MSSVVDHSMDAPAMILRMFRRGHDTKVIARFTGLAEHEAFNLLAAARDAEHRAKAEWDAAAPEFVAGAPAAPTTHRPPRVSGQPSLGVSSLDWRAGSPCPPFSGEGV